MFGFASTESRFGQYQKLYPGHKDEDSAENRSRNNSDESDAPGTASEMSLGRKSTDTFRLLLPVLIGMNVFLSVALLCVVIIVARRPAQQLRSEVQFIGQAEIPVEIELYRFATGVREKTDFWGAPNATTDAAWGTILNGECPHTRPGRANYSHSFLAGLVRLTSEQAGKLSAPTAKSRQDPTSYVGILEVFHQLHCLVCCAVLATLKHLLCEISVKLTIAKNILRRRLYSSESGFKPGDAFHTGKPPARVRGRNFSYAHST